MSLSYTISLCFSNGGGDSVCVPGALSTVISAGQWSHWCHATCTAHQRCESAITILYFPFFNLKKNSYAHTFCPFKTRFVCFKVSDHPKFSHARHSIFLPPSPIPSIFLNCCIHPCIFQQLIIHVLDLLFVSTGPCHQRSAGFPA